MSLSSWILVELLFHYHRPSRSYRWKTGNTGGWVVCCGCARGEHQGGDMFLCPFPNKLQPQITGRCLGEDGRAAGHGRTDSPVPYIARTEQMKPSQSIFPRRCRFAISLETHPVSSSDFVFIYFLNPWMVCLMLLFLFQHVSLGLWNSQNWKCGVLFCFHCHIYCVCMGIEML